MNHVRTSLSKRLASMAILLVCCGSMESQAAVVTWDAGGGDGLWVTATNWDSDTVPVAGDTIHIGNGDTVDGLGLPGSGSLPNSSTINLTGSSTLTMSAGAIRMSGSTLSVGSGSTLAGGFWDLDDATLTFADGAIANMANWEQKDTNVFNFELGAAGFNTLTPNTFRIGNGSLTGDIANATYNVDLANYTGGTGVITLVDFASDAASMDNATFQGAGGLNILNAGVYTANLQWNDSTEAIELNVSSATAVPEPSSIILFGIGAVGVCLRSRRKRKIAS